MLEVEDMNPWKTGLEEIYHYERIHHSWCWFVHGNGMQSCVVKPAGFVSATSVKILAIVRDGISKQRKDEEHMLISS